VLIAKLQSAQIKAAVSVNRELLQLYWFIAEQTVQKQPAVEVKIEFYTGIIVLTFLSVENGYLRSTVTGSKRVH
jgi:hypothetical protein